MAPGLELAEISFGLVGHIMIDPIRVGLVINMPVHGVIAKQFHQAAGRCYHEVIHEPENDM